MTHEKEKKRGKITLLKKILHQLREYLTLIYLYKMEFKKIIHKFTVKIHTVGILMFMCQKGERM